MLDYHCVFFVLLVSFKQSKGFFILPMHKVMHCSENLTQRLNGMLFLFSYANLPSKNSSAVIVSRVGMFGVKDYKVAYMGFFGKLQRVITSDSTLCVLSFKTIAFFPGLL